MALCGRLRRRGHECEIVTLGRLWDHAHPLPSTDIVEGVRVHRIPFVGGRRFFVAPGSLS